MQFKFKRKHLDYLYWLFPVIFMGLAFFAISQDKQNRKSDLRTVKNIKADSSMTINTGAGMSDSLSTQLFDNGISVPIAQ